MPATMPSQSSMTSDSASVEKGLGSLYEPSDSDHKAPASSEKYHQQQQPTEQQIQPAEPPAPPDGGLKAWLTVAGSSAGLFVSFGWSNCIGLFQEWYETHQLKNYSSPEVAWITSAEFFFMLAFYPVAGKLFDNYGPRVPLIIGLLMHVFGLMMASLSNEYYQFFFSQSVCSGIGASMIFMPCIAAPQTYFRIKRGIAGGFTVAGSSLGGVIFPLMTQHLIPKVGFPWAIRTCAFLIFGLLLFSIATVTSNITHQPHPFSLMDYMRPLKELNFVIFVISCFFMYWGMFIPFDMIPVAAQHYGMPPSLAISLVPILNGASFFGRTVPNIVADRLGRFNVIVFMCFLSAILCLALWLPARSNAASITFAALYGISSGAGIGLGPVLIAQISPIGELGTRMGVIMAFASIGTLTSPPIGAAIASAAGGTYVYTALFAGINFIFTGTGLWLLRTRVAGWSLKKAV